MSDYKTPMNGESMKEALNKIVKEENERIQKVEETLKKLKEKMDKNGNWD
jgi:hypothetical protein